MQEEAVSAETDTTRIMYDVSNTSTSKDINISIKKPEMFLFIENIPNHLKSIKRWLLWEFEFNGTKWDKKPLTTWSNPECLMTFKDIIIARDNNKDIGVGFVFSDEDNIVGIDIDKCFSPIDKMLSPSIDKLINEINGYTEVTPSKMGLHIIGKVKDKSLYTNQIKIPFGGCDHIEFYKSGRYFTFTGTCNKELPKDIDFLNEKSLEVFYKRSGDGKSFEKFELPIDITEGGRNNIIFKHACSLRDKGLGKLEILGSIKETNRLRCKPPLSNEELEVISDQAIKYKPTSPIEVVPVDNKSIIIENSVCDQIKNDVDFDIKSLPDNHLIKNYVEYGKTIQDAYEEYHMINIMSLISTIVITKNTPTFGSLFNNTWFIAIGRAGESGKSTAIGLLNKLIKDISIHYPIFKMPDKPTPESFVQLLSENNKRIMVSDEISGFFKYLRRDYAKELIENILQTYSHNDISRSTIVKKNGTGGLVTCKDPHINYLWYTTPDAFNNHVDNEWYVNGFCQRIMYIIAMRDKEFMKDRSMTTEDELNYQKILNQCMNLSLLSRKCNIIFEENDILVSWKDEMRKRGSIKDSDIKRSAITRSYEYLRKLTMILIIGSDEFISDLSKQINIIERKDKTGGGDIDKTLVGNDGNISISNITSVQYSSPTQALPTIVFKTPDWAVNTAIKWTDNFLDNFFKVHRMSMIDGNGITMKLKVYLRETENGWASRTDCQGIVNKHGRMFDEYINDLIAEGLVEMGMTKIGYNDRRKTMYRWVGE